MTDAQTTAPSGLYAFTECEVVHMLNGAVMLIDKFSDGQLLVAAPVAQSMELCRKFRTLEQHADVLALSVPELAGQQADILNVLGMLKDAGLLVTADSVCERLNAEVAAPVDLPPTRVFIITCDRPTAVERLLESMLRTGNLSRHEALFLIDDSRDSANADQNRDAVERFNLTSPRDMHYFGADEARHFMDALVTEQPEQEDAIRFLIDREKWTDHKTYGVARNLSLLLSVDCRAIVMDDDVICNAFQSPHKKEGLEFRAVDREVDFYANQQDMLNNAQPNELDPLSGHAQCLGLTIGQAARKLGDKAITPNDLADANSGSFILWDAESPVLVTQSGTLGDPGSPNTSWLYFTSGDSLKRLMSFPGGLQGALTGRNYWMGHPRPCFAKMAVMSQVTGLDNSQLLPPYFPVFRGEDYLFGSMTEYLHPNSAVLHYDFCVPHIPVDERSASAEPEPSDGKSRLSIGKYVTDRTDYQAGISPEARLAGLAAMAKRLSETDDRGLQSLYRKEVAELQGLDQVQLDSLLKDGTIRSPEWQGWLEQSASNVNQSMQQAAVITDMPSLPKGECRDAVLETFRRYAASFAESLQQWRAIRRTAKVVGANMYNHSL
ncbi:MAG: hypothetical protein ABJN62_13215 [Halioglobus sp.]